MLDVVDDEPAWRPLTRESSANCSAAIAFAIAVAAS